MPMPGATWYKEFGTCIVCGKQATVTLYNSTNSSMGPYCKRCAEKRIKADQSK